MSVQRIAVALIFGLFISGASTFWMAKHLRGNVGAPSPTHQYVAAARDLQPGEVLNAADLKLVTWPTNMPLEGALTSVEAATGRVVIYPTTAGEPLVSHLLAPAGSGLGMAGQIPDGMRAISLRSDEVVGVAGFIMPGTWVDVLLTYRPLKSPEPITETVLQRVKVLATGHQLQPDPDGKPSSVNVVTLLLSSDDAQKAVLASTQGTIHFVLRNGTDAAQGQNASTSLSGITRLPANTETAETPKPKPHRKPYVDETIFENRTVFTSFANDHAR